MTGVFTVNVSPFIVGIYTYYVIVFVGGHLLGCKNSVTVNTFNVLGHVRVLFIVVIVNVAVKVRPVAKCGCNTRRFSHMGEALGLKVATKYVVAALKFVVNRLFPNMFINVFASGRRLASRTALTLEVNVLSFPIMNTRVIVARFFRSVKGTQVSVFLSLSHRLLFLLPKLTFLPPFCNIRNM